jgi:SAM-dependent methyltransferase
MGDALTGRTRSFYQEVAGSYAELLPDVRFESPIELALIRDFVDQAGGAAGSRAAGAAIDLLDAGCGTGRLISYLRGLSGRARVTGADLAPAMLEHARAAHPDVEFVEAALATLPFPDARFDGVLAWYSIIHTAPDDLRAVFAELRRVLRPGGAVLLGFQAGEGERTRAGAYGHDIELHAFLHTTSAVSAALQSVGLDIDTTIDRAPRPPSELRPQGFVLARRPVEADPATLESPRAPALGSRP